MEQKSSGKPVETGVNRYKASMNSNKPVAHMTPCLRENTVARQLGNTDIGYITEINNSLFSLRVAVKDDDTRKIQIMKLLLCYYEQKTVIYTV